MSPSLYETAKNTELDGHTEIHDKYVRYLDICIDIQRYIDIMAFKSKLTSPSLLCHVLLFLLKIRHPTLSSGQGGVGWGIAHTSLNMEVNR